jgi:hypothetical protein
MCGRMLTSAKMSCTGLFFVRACAIKSRIAGGKPVFILADAQALAIRDFAFMKTLTRREKAIRAAAYVDTEGSFYVRKDGTAVITVTNTDRRLTDWLQAEYGGSVFLQTRPAGANRKPVWRWRVSSRKAIRFLLEIEPFLVIKSAQADVAFNAQMARRIAEPEQSGKYYRQQMQVLNQRGIR